MDEAYRSKGLTIVAVPCNQFGDQEPGSSAEIRAFVEPFGVKFLMTAKSDVNGAGTHEIYTHVKARSDPKDIKWNFASKFLVSSDGMSVTRHNVRGAKELEPEILKLLGSTKI